MANIATCPQCAKQLGLPESIAITDRAECPECHAVFMLSETVQISLPLARLCDPTESLPAAASSPVRGALSALVPPKALPREHSPPDDPPPRASWEERLKRALARDAGTETVTETATETATEIPTQSLAETTKQTLQEFSTSIQETTGNDPADLLRALAGCPTTADTSLSTAPGLELELDLSTPDEIGRESPELDRNWPAAQLGGLPASHSPVNGSPTLESPAVGPEGRQRKAPTKTLAEFAASAIPTLKESDPQRLRSDSPSAADTVRTTSETTVASSLDIPIQAADEPSEPAAKVVERDLREPPPSRRFPFFAALVVGPVLGSLLGLYGLLWLQGPQADVVGLSRVLPASLLPTPSPTELPAALAEARQAHSQPPAASLAATAKSLVPAARPPQAQAGPSSAALKRDKAVMPASAVRAVHPIASSAPLNANEFFALVDAAAAALPDLTGRDLATEDSMKRKGQAYMALCRLAESFDFAQQPALSLQVQRKARQAARLFQLAAQDPSDRQDLSHIAAVWWEYSQRANSGIFLTGRVSQTRSVGNGTVCWVKLGEEATAPLLPVWFAQPTYHDGDSIGVVGKISATSTEYPVELIGPAMVEANYSFPLQVAP